ncbi:hypothetical protein BKA57DRAFT_531889 [Linnemannia elongata]|nr:hypothetical protein BKA57DRAFT_531889 [Linnemannia elongata]
MPATTVDSGYFDAALRIVNVALHGRINHTAQTSLANDIICVAAGLRSAALIEQLYLCPNDIERIQSMFHHTMRFNHLDLLSIGPDHIFIIHRQLLHQDIHEYLAESEHGLHRVFINVDYLLSQPEILPGRRYEPLDNYLKKHLLPDLEMRIQCWDQAELCHLPLPAPDHINDSDTTMRAATVDRTPATSELIPYTETTAVDDDPAGLGLSMVTLSGWLLGYPVNYVLPTTASMMARKRAARALKLQERALLRQQRLAAKLLRHQQQQQYIQQQGMDEDQVLPTTTVRHDSTDCNTCVDDGNMSDDEGDSDNKYDQRGQSPIEEEDDDEEEVDSSHNSLANRLLVLTEVNLTANEDIEGLEDCCLFSFSYPSAILNRQSLATTGAAVPSLGGQLPTTPVSPPWFTGTSINPSADQEMNPFETSLLSSNTAQSYSTTMPGALPPTPPAALAVVPSIVPLQKSSYLAPPSMNQHRKESQHCRESSSIHPFDTAPDTSSSDDPSSSSSSSPYIDRHHRNTASVRDRSRSRSRGRSQSQSRRRSSNLVPSSSDIDQYRLHRSEEPLYHQQQQHQHRHLHHQHHNEEVSKTRIEENHEPLPQGHPEICAAGRSMLQVLHSRFQQQGVWKTWEVGQQTVTLPVVAL